MFIAGSTALVVPWAFGLLELVPSLTRALSGQTGVPLAVQFAQAPLSLAPLLALLVLTVALVLDVGVRAFWLPVARTNFR